MSSTIETSLSSKSSMSYGLWPSRSKSLRCSAEILTTILRSAKYFNGLLRLEEDYHKNCKIITRCWEELIDCNDGAVVHFQDSLKEHDQNISARTFPRSLIPLQPAFPRRRA
ncbi:hypothetical protein L210DRAFT_2832926 [Boletus edulis BED1]|uniref:Uncharacterized protein n=1 Tax=Boletus edulis BED1 TaxID=1328754 RepID=A0AAD4C4C9_BOLED|nr:hypothetical protein L210DRAFT_2832926 [Boletus edulis BED1]